MFLHSTQAIHISTFSPQIHLVLYSISILRIKYLAPCYILIIFIPIRVYTVQFTDCGYRLCSICRFEQNFILVIMTTGNRPHSLALFPCCLLLPFLSPFSQSFIVPDSQFTWRLANQIIKDKQLFKSSWSSKKATNPNVFSKFSINKKPCNAS